MPQLFIIKICFTIKVNTILWCGSEYQDSVSQVQFSWSCSQDSWSQGRKSQILGTQFQGPGCQGLEFRCHRVLGFRNSGPGSQVLILCYAISDSSFVVLQIFNYETDVLQSHKSKRNFLNMTQILFNGYYTRMEFIFQEFIFLSKPDLRIIRG